MRKHILKYILCICLLGSILKPAHSQINDVIKPLLIADSVSSANYKDVLTSFFQVALRNLTDSNKSFEFNSNLFAYMLKHNPNLDIDTNYFKYTLARNTNVSLKGQLNEHNNFGGVTLGIKHALVNSRDYTISEKFISLVESKNHDLFVINRCLVKERTKLSPTDRERYADQTSKLFSDSAFTFDKLDPDIREFVIKCANDSALSQFLHLIKHNPNISLYQYGKSAYKEAINSFQNKPLWIIGVDLNSYTDKFQFQDIVFESEFLKGFLNPNDLSNLELDLKTNFILSNDSTKEYRNLDNKTIALELGLNWVLKGWKENQSFLELKLSGAQEVELNTQNNDFFLKGDVKIRVSDNIWIPLQLKYEPGTNNLFGFINVTSNFTRMGN